MRGLKTQESTKFNAFFELIQSEAKKMSSVFFADAADGREFETPTMEGENMMGWLVPDDKVPEFEPLWEAAEVDDTWTEFFKWAVWSRSGNEISIEFED